MLYAPPLVADDTLDAILLGKRLIQESMVRLEQVEHGTILAKHIFKKQNRLFVHVAPQLGELGVQLFVFVVVLVEVAQVQPLTGELDG